MAIAPRRNLLETSNISVEGRVAGEQVVERVQNQNESHCSRVRVLSSYLILSQPLRNSGSVVCSVAQLYLDATLLCREPVVPHWDRSGINLSIYLQLLPRPLSLDILCV